MSELRIRFPSIRRGRRTVLEAGEFSAALPAAVAVVGINGSGKSSLFMRLTDTLANASGTGCIHVDGPVGTIAYAPQLPALPLWLRVEHAVELYSLDFSDLMRSMTELHLGELAGRRCGALSLGQQQVLSMAIALALPSRVLILDEPFSALDFRRRLGGLELIRRWREARSDRALLLSSQNAADLVSVCDTFVVLRGGRLVFTGSRAALAPASDALDEIEQRLMALLT